MRMRLLMACNTLLRTWLQLQRMPKPGIARAGTPPAPALFGAPAPLIVASSAPAGRAHLGRSISLPGASELAGGGLKQEPPPQQQQQFALSKQQQLGKQRSDVGPIAGWFSPELLGGDSPSSCAAREPVYFLHSVMSLLVICLHHCCLSGT